MFPLMSWTSLGSRGGLWGNHVWSFPSGLWSSLLSLYVILLNISFPSYNRTSLTLFADFEGSRDRVEDVHPLSVCGHDDDELQEVNGFQSRTQKLVMTATAKLHLSVPVWPFYFSKPLGLTLHTVLSDTSNRLNEMSGISISIFLADVGVACMKVLNSARL